MQSRRNRERNRDRTQALNLCWNLPIGSLSIENISMEAPRWESLDGVALIWNVSQISSRLKRHPDWIIISIGIPLSIAFRLDRNVSIGIPTHLEAHLDWSKSHLDFSYSRSHLDSLDCRFLDFLECKSHPDSLESDCNSMWPPISILSSRLKTYLDRIISIDRNIFSIETSPEISRLEISSKLRFLEISFRLESHLDWNLNPIDWNIISIGRNRLSIDGSRNSIDRSHLDWWKYSLISIDEKYISIHGNLISIKIKTLEKSKYHLDWWRSHPVRSKSHIDWWNSHLDHWSKYHLHWQRYHLG